MSSLLLLPGQPGFDETMATAMQPGWQQTRDSADGFFAFALRADGLMVPLADDELDDYLLGGEYDEVMENADRDSESLLEENQEGWLIRP
jgi:hypothetical protein